LDVVFKRVFSGSDDDSREALKSLLSACIHRKVTGVQVLNTELPPEYQDGKTIRLDVHVALGKGEAADLEMQMEMGSDNIPARAVFYVSKLLVGQVEKGQLYEGIKRVYQIFFINKVLFPGNMVPRRYTLMEKTTHEPLNDLMEIVFYELPKLEAKVRQVVEGKAGVETLSPEERWCTFFRCQHDEGMAELIKELTGKDGGIMSAEKVLYKVSRDYEEWAKALAREKVELDYRSGMYNARQSGLKENEQKVRAARQEVRAARQEVRAAKQEIQAVKQAAKQQVQAIEQQAQKERETAEQKIADLERKLREAGL
jgi:predicted transposase/invertase (TIGR01784 family)